MSFVLDGESMGLEFDDSFNFDFDDSMEFGLKDWLSLKCPAFSCFVLSH